MPQPSGTVTVLFAGIEASGWMWPQGNQIGGAFLAALLRSDVALSSEGMAGR